MRQLDLFADHPATPVAPTPSAKVKSAPSPSKASGPFGAYSVEVTADGATLRVKTTVTLSKTRVAASDYRAFRAWCEEVDRALGQRDAASRWRDNCAAHTVTPDIRRGARSD